MTAEKGRSITCLGCGNVLGGYVGPSVTEIIQVDRHKRRIIAAQVIAIVCEQCGAVWKPPMPDISRCQ